MNIIGIIKKGEYYDSISIMLIAKHISEMEGVDDSAVVMGTKENKSILTSSGLMTPDVQPAGEMDLIVALKLKEGVDSKNVLYKIDEIFKATKKSDDGENFTPQSIDGALNVLPDANMAMISVAGRYAGDVAMKSLQRGLHVMLFSDNVPIEKEIELKKFARENNLFVMGPDCGTAIINGVPLAFANVVNKGNIGVVAASGTGLQEVTCLISNAGCGISQAIGTGGRDVRKEVGGIMFIEGIKALTADPNTDVILLVSKPPATEVVEKIISVARGIRKPVVGVFLGASPEFLKGSNIRQALTLEEAAMKAVALSKHDSIESVDENLKSRTSEIEQIAKVEKAKLSLGQKYLRALYSGGTFCDEAQLLCQNVLGEVYSNIPFGSSKKLKDSSKSEKHTILDLGDDEFTVGKPHPMIDYSTRNKRIISEAEDPETAVILLDIVLGYGSNMDPLVEIIPVLKEVKKITVQQKRYVPVVCSVTGTDKDPQNRTAVVTALGAGGVKVMESNAAASMLAISIINR
ncbi:MAG: acyl-CoA synthetase FdrA [Bacteroidota bacterium]|nr:acyl-CoA synthetase FdrA [Bacteroidota bacterium]